MRLIVSFMASCGEGTEVPFNIKERVGGVPGVVSDKLLKEVTDL